MGRKKSFCRCTCLLLLSQTGTTALGCEFSGHLGWQSHLTANFRELDSKAILRRFDGYNGFFDEEWLCLSRFPNFNFKETLQKLHFSLGLVSDIYALHNLSHIRFSEMFWDSMWTLYVCLFLSEMSSSFRFILISQFFFTEDRWSATN